MPDVAFADEKYEHDDCWTAVDAYGVSKLQNKDPSTAAILDGVLEHIRNSGMPIESTYPAFAKFLALQARCVKAKHVLEVGLLGGYTAIWMALLNPEARITSLELSEHHVKVAKENGIKAGVIDRMEIIVGSAAESLKKIQEEISSGQRPKFDFTFIDADKENNWTYFDYAAGMNNSGAPIIVDNVVCRGYIVKDGHIHDDLVNGARKVIEKAGKDPRVESCLMQTVSEKNYDGFLYAIVK